MDRFNNFFRKNYDLYVLCALIIVSFGISLLDYFSGLAADMPCFISEQEDFIQDASLNIGNLLPPGKFFDSFFQLKAY